MDGIAVDGLELHLLVVGQDGEGEDGRRRDDVSVGQDDTTLRVDKEAGGRVRTYSKGASTVSCRLNGITAMSL